nr:methyltransferase domain-containing protein [Pedobacter panaciterrae]
MEAQQMFNKESYERHQQWYNLQFPTEQSKVDYLKKNSNILHKDNLGVWIQNIFFGCLDPLLADINQKWLTIGDAYGFDAQYIIGKNNFATASDLNIDFLQISKKEGLIDNISSQNAEHLSYNNDQFDFLLCKEAYHHFPRPYAALYEMIRVAKKAIVVIEPQDPVSKMAGLLFFLNIFSALKSNIANLIWKNRFSYEPVGNFVYKISEREMEKFAAGLNLPLVAFKKINPNFYFRGADEVECTLKNPRFLKVFFKKKLLDGLVKIRLIPSQVLSAIVFKEIPDETLLMALKNGGYQLVYIPKNPYLTEC